MAQRVKKEEHGPYPHPQCELMFKTVIDQVVVRITETIKTLLAEAFVDRDRRLTEVEKDLYGNGVDGIKTLTHDLHEWRTDQTRLTEERLREKRATHRMIVGITVGNVVMLLAMLVNTVIIFTKMQDHMRDAEIHPRIFVDANRPLVFTDVTNKGQITVIPRTKTEVFHDRQN